MLLNYFVKY